MLQKLPKLSDACNNEELQILLMCCFAFLYMNLIFFYPPNTSVHWDNFGFLIYHLLYLLFLSILLSKNFNQYGIKFILKVTNECVE